MKGKFQTLIGTALTLALTSHVAAAESTKFLISQQSQSGSPSPSAAPEIKLSPQGKKILCEYFPLNSRCQTTSGATPNPSGRSTETQSAPSDSNTRSTDQTPTNRVEPGAGATDRNSPANLPGRDATTPDGSIPGTLVPAPGTSVTPETNRVQPDAGITEQQPGAVPDPSAPGTIKEPGALTDPSAPGSPNPPNQIPNPSVPPNPGSVR